MEKWRTVGRPGYFGRHRDAKFAEYDAEFGKGRWRIVWRIGSYFFSFEEVVLLYEDAYFRFLTDKSHAGLKTSLIHAARDVYDDDPR